MMLFQAWCCKGEDTFPSSLKEHPSAIYFFLCFGILFAYSIYQINNLQQSGTTI